MHNFINFDTQLPHIVTSLDVKSKTGKTVSFRAIVDTGAAITEISDRSLIRAGFQVETRNVSLSPFQQTKKLSKIHFIEANTLARTLRNWTVHVSRFDESWNIDALIGLDFFRQHCVTINYQQGKILSEAYQLSL